MKKRGNPNWKKGVSANPKGMPKGAHHIGRPPDKIKELCQNFSYSILERFIDISHGEDTEQVVNDQGETIRLPARIPDQIRAGEVVLGYGIGKPKETIELHDERRPTSEEIFRALTAIELLQRDIAKGSGMDSGK